MHAEVGGPAAFEFGVIQIADILQLRHGFAHRVVLRVEVRRQVESVSHTLHGDGGRILWQTFNVGIECLCGLLALQGINGFQTQQDPPVHLIKLKELGLCPDLHDIGSDVVIGRLNQVRSPPFRFTLKLEGYGCQLEQGAFILSRIFLLERRESKPHILTNSTKTA